MKMAVAVIVESEDKTFPGWEDFGRYFAAALDRAGNSGVLVWQPVPPPNGVPLPIVPTPQWEVLQPLTYRKGPGIEFPRLGTLEKGAIVRELKREGDWLAHEFGWSNCRYMRKLE